MSSQWSLTELHFCLQQAQTKQINNHKRPSWHTFLIYKSSIAAVLHTKTMTRYCHSVPRSGPTTPPQSDAEHATLFCGSSIQAVIFTHSLGCDVPFCVMQIPSATPVCSGGALWNTPILRCNYDRLSPFFWLGPCAREQLRGKNNRLEHNTELVPYKHCGRRSAHMYSH